MKLRTDEMDLYQDPSDLPLSVNLDELILLRDLIGGCTMGDATETRIRLYVELTRTLNEARHALAAVTDPWGELR